MDMVTSVTSMGRSGLYDWLMHRVTAVILLAYFLGMCSFVAISKNMETSIGLGAAVVFVLAITTPMNWLIYHYLLSPGALSWLGLPTVDLSYLKFITFIAVIAVSRDAYPVMTMTTVSGCIARIWARASRNAAGW